jgi:hypothetical protein
MRIITIGNLIYSTRIRIYDFTIPNSEALVIYLWIDQRGLIIGGGDSTNYFYMVDKLDIEINQGNISSVR